MTKVKDLHRRWSKDRDYKASYDGLEEEFQLARTLIEARTRAGLSQTQLARRMKTSKAGRSVPRQTPWSASLKRPARGSGSRLSQRLFADGTCSSPCFRVSV